MCAERPRSSTPFITVHVDHRWHRHRVAAVSAQASLPPGPSRTTDEQRPAGRRPSTRRPSGRRKTQVPTVVYMLTSAHLKPPDTTDNQRRPAAALLRQEAPPAPGQASDRHASGRPAATES